nr:MAG TPA: hypothetical protein [Caudoviricetes sp.]
MWIWIVSRTRTLQCYRKTLFGCMSKCSFLKLPMRFLLNSIYNKSPLLILYR